MATVTLYLEGEPAPLEVRTATWRERLGEAGRVELVLGSAEAVDVAPFVGAAASVVWDEASGSRAMRGVVVRASAVATVSRSGRTYRMVIDSSIARLEHVRRSRVFQDMSLLDVARAVLTAGGWPANLIDDRTSATHEPRRYLVQHDETDAAFLRRICEDEGLYFFFDAHDGEDRIVLADTSTAVEDAEIGPILVGDDSGLVARTGYVARELAIERRRAPGKVRLRDYDRTHPTLELEGIAEGGTDREKTTEVYRAPGGFVDAGGGKARAGLWLESLRAETTRVSFVTNAVAIGPGSGVVLAMGHDTEGPVFEGALLVVASEWRYEHAKETVRHLTCIPRDVPFRLARITPRPLIHGVHSAVVTGEAGSEIHPDADGCVFVHFHWDREGPTDHTSSLPVRVAQPNMTGTMLIPRVGWEVAVGFEDGDPDRPYVLGRLYNAKQPPPVALPANKTMTSIETPSSPGAAKTNAIHFDDAAGRQHVKIVAAHALTSTIANDKKVKVVNVEKTNILGSHTRTVGATESINVGQARFLNAGSQSTTVGGAQHVYVKGHLGVNVGSETVLIGGALLEKVGNPVTGLKNLAVNVALAGVGAIGDKLGGVAGAVATVAQMGGNVAWSMYQAATAPGAGPNAARDAGIKGVLGIGAGMIPGGDAVLASAGSFGLQFPWEKPAAPAGGTEAGGGAGAAASNSAAANAPGPGHRNEKVSGAMAEIIGAAHAVITPGEIKAQTTGASMIGVGASHSTKAVKTGARVMGSSAETVGSLHWKATKDVVRATKATVTTTVGGPLQIKSSGKVDVKSTGDFTLKVGGALKLQGAKVSFNVGDSSVSSSPGGVVVKSGSITITLDTDQSKPSTHA